MTDKAEDCHRKIARLEKLVEEEHANTRMLLEIVRKQTVILETQRLMLRECEEVRDED